MTTPQDLDTDAIDKLKGMVESLTTITLSGHSYGLEACKFLGDIIKDAKNLKVGFGYNRVQRINFSNIFIGKLKEEIPENLKALLQGIVGKDIDYVDLSDNAFGPSGVPGFDFFIKSTPSIKVLKMINCGLGPFGGPKLAECLIEGKLQLTEFYGSRNRLEDVGFKSVAEALKQMGSLVSLEMMNNFAKKEGMIAMIDACKSNPTLERIHIHDNWLKEEAIKEYVVLIESLDSLKSINISDCDIGGLGVKKIIRALKNSKSKDVIEEVYCNYNDVERTKTAKFIFGVFRDCKNLKLVSFIGNMIKTQLKKEYMEEYEKADKTLLLLDEEEELDEDDDEELSEEDEEGEDEADEADPAKELETQLKDLKLE